MAATGLGAGARMQSYRQLSFREEYGPGWLELGAVVGEVLDHSKGSYLCVQRGFGSLCLGPRDFLDLERSGSFNLTSVQLL